MPNWVRNELNITDFTDNVPFDFMLLKLVEFVKETMPNYENRLDRSRKDWEKEKLDEHLRVHPRCEFDFNNIVPYPARLLAQDNDYNTLSKKEFEAKYPDKETWDEGYHWRIHNWGTKWNACDSMFFLRQKTFYFDTAWGDATTIISALHKLFPTAWFNYEYYEMGQAFMGGCEFVPEKYWDSADYSSEAVPKIEKAMKLVGACDQKWEAGTPYNPWYVENYGGFKGG